MALTNRLLSSIAFSLLLLCTVRGQFVFCYDYFNFTVKPLPEGLEDPQRISFFTDTIRYTKSLYANVDFYRVGEFEKVEYKVSGDINEVNTIHYSDMEEPVKHIAFGISNLNFEWIKLYYYNGPDLIEHSCYTNKRIIVDTSKCTKPEADKNDGYAFTEPHSAVISENRAIIDEESGENVISWTYKNDRNVEKMCRCSKWQGAYSTRSGNVWNDQYKVILEELDCPDDPKVGTFTMSYTDIFYRPNRIAFPNNTWFAVSVNEVGERNTGSTLYGLRLCLRPGMSYGPNITPNVVYFFDTTKTTVTVSWNEEEFPTSRCGEKQKVNLLYKRAQFEAEIPFNDIPNDYQVEVSVEGNHDINHSFVLQMGSDSWENFTILNVYDCTYLRNSFEYKENENTDDERWQFSISLNWDGECAGLVDNSWYEAFFEVKNHLNNSEIIQSNYTGLSTALPFVLDKSFSNLVELSHSHYLDASITVNIYHNDTGSLIGSYHHDHKYCSKSDPVLSDNIIVKSDAICEASSESVPIILEIPYVENYGLICDDNTQRHTTLTQKNSSGNATDFSDVQSGEWKTEVQCPSEGETVEYNYTYTVYNGPVNSSVQSAPIVLCRNTNPERPSNLKVNSVEDSSTIAIVSTTEHQVNLSWVLDGDKKWGNCKDYSFEKHFEVQVEYEGQSSSEEQSPIRVYDGSSVDVTIPFESETRKSVTWTVTAIRDGEYSTASYPHTFTACKLAAPGEPVPFLQEEQLTHDSEKFNWTIPSYHGENCATDPGGIELVYIFQLYSGTEVKRKVPDITENEAWVDVEEFSGSYMWTVTACIKDTELCTESAKSPVNIKFCENKNPSSNPGVVNPNNTQLNFSEDSRVTIPFSWPTPDWGTICHDKTMTRHMSLYIDDKFVKSYNVAVSDKNKKETIYDLNEGSHSWFVNSMTKYQEDGTSEASDIVTTTRGSFDVCIFSQPKYTLKTDVESGGRWIIIAEDEGKGPFTLELLKNGNLKSCGGTFVGRMSVDLSKEMNIDPKIDPKIDTKTEFSKTDFQSLPIVFANVNEGEEAEENYFVRVSHVPNSFIMTVRIATSLHDEITPVVITKYDVCIPQKPTQPTVILTGSNKDGQMKADWGGSLPSIRTSGCSSKDITFYYTITYPPNETNPEGLTISGTTKKTSLDIKGYSNGLHTVSVSVNNGYYSFDNSISEPFYLCFHEYLPPVSLKSPKNGKVVWHENVLFEFEPLAAAKQDCTNVKYQLVITEEGGSQTTYDLAPGSSSLKIRQLEFGTDYTWNIRRTTFQNGTEEGKNYTFSTCGVQPEINELTADFPDGTAPVIKKDKELFFNWTIDSTIGCGMQWKYVVYISKNSNFDGARSYTTDDVKYPMPKLDGTNNDGTTYWWKVIAKNIESSVTNQSDPVSFTYCECGKPGVPVISYPTSAAVRSNGGYFISRIVDPGRSCEPEGSPLYYSAEINMIGGSYSLRYDANYNSTTETRDNNGAYAVRIGAIPENLPYGTYTWSVTATNGANLKSTSTSTIFVVCDDPKPVELVSPVDNANTSHLLVFRWNRESVSYGYSCTIGAPVMNSMTIIVEEVEFEDSSSSDSSGSGSNDSNEPSELSELSHSTESSGSIGSSQSSQSIGSSERSTSSGSNLNARDVRSPSSSSSSSSSSSGKKEPFYSHVVNAKIASSEWNATDDLLSKIKLGKHYKWYMIVSNAEMSVKTEERFFHVTEKTCPLFKCYNGGVCITSNASGVECKCASGYSGAQCSSGGNEVNLGLILGTSIAAFLVLVAIVLIIVMLLIRKRRRESRTRVVLKGPVKDLRFTRVKLTGEQGDISSCSSSEIESLRARLKDDAENGGFALSIAILANTPSTSVENTCKALLYAHHRDHHDVALLKALIRGEVLSSAMSEVIFRSNSSATLTFKHLSKMVGLDYLFATIGKVIRDVIQKDADDTAVEERMKKDKNLAELMVMQDTYEVDPTKLDDQSEEDLLCINSIQLTLLVQRFIKNIFQSADKMPLEIHEVMAEVKSSVSQKFPDAVQNALSAFLFLRFFNCGIAVPESYGILEEPPNPNIRRSLVLATKILTTMASGAHFGDKEAFMTQFNEIIDKNQKGLAAFYDTVCDESQGNYKPSEFVDTPSDIYADSMAVVAHFEKRVNATAEDGKESSSKS